ncbi:MAG TPA: hypothetical protein VH369_25095 [Bryobacteraceae bacterium]
MTLRLVPMPYPYEHDEFSYLLGADTFALGRLTNPPHPRWVHFETFDENFQPTYASKYPPGQSLLLAFGQKFLGHPWYGVWISFGLMFGCLCWMLQGWLPPVYALLGSLVAMGEFSIFGYWMNSYWGGALTTAGGCLILGALPRLVHKHNPFAAIAGSTGLLILLNTRPYEGGVLSLATFAVLLWWKHRRGYRVAEMLTALLLMPFVLICGFGMAWTGYYNYRVTGNPLLSPYVLHERTYAATPASYLLPRVPAPIYHRDVIRRAWVDWSGESYTKLRANPARVLVAFYDVLPFYLPALLFFSALAGLIFFARNLKIRAVIALLTAIWLALLLEKVWLPHYFAPAAGLLLLPIMYSVRWLRLRFAGAGAALVLLFVACCVGRGLATVVSARRELVVPPQEQAIEKINTLSKPGERYLIIVRYRREHNFHVEYVFNRADIDHSRIVWARDMGDAKNQELFHYYPDRHVLLLEPDLPAMPLTPYPK